MTEIDKHNNIFTWDVYHGRQDRDYSTKIFDIVVEEACWLIAKRAEEDGVWCIQNDLVGDNADTMVEMMNYVKNPVNVAKVFEALRREDRNETLDQVARILANSSKWKLGTNPET
jgi:hypothetical protein